MREIEPGQVSGLVGELCVTANRTLPPDVLEAMRRARGEEPWQPAQKTLDEMLCNVLLARETQLPICQDTGMACVFVEWGQDAHLSGGSLQQAVDEGVRRGYAAGCLRNSIVGDPLQRANTGDNTPASVTLAMVPGDAVKITVMPKGFGSENMSRAAMLKPADGKRGVEDFVFETIYGAGANPCPPVIVGVGIGGSFDKVALLAKKALLRPLDTPHSDPFYAEMEQGLLARINRIGTGPAGYGGLTTALGVLIETAPTHIAGLPVAVNVSCHVTRRACGTL